MKKSPLTLNPQRARDVAFILREKLKGEGIFGKKKLPDDMAEKLLKKLDEDAFLLFVTLTVSLDYMRDAEKLWESSLKTLQDEEVNWIFSPNKVAKKGKEKLKEAMSKYKLAIRKDKDTSIWFRLSETLLKEFGGSVSNLFDKYNYDVEKIFRVMKERREEFPSLSGDKIFPHWIRSLKEKKGFSFKNLRKLPIPVDVHVARATFTTGCITGSYKAKGITGTIRKKVIEVWEKGLEGTEITPIEMFRPLWLLSKYGCHYRKNGERPKLHECPVKDFCVDGKVVITSKKVEVET